MSAGVSAKTLALAAGAARRREPLARRTYQPVRRNSRMTGGWEHGYTRSLTWREANEIRKAATVFDRLNKQAGDRHGPLGAIALDLLEELLALSVNCRGRVWPSLTWLQGRLKRTRDTIVRALAALKAAGLVEWVRRIDLAEGDAPRGQRVRQISNLYRLQLPQALRRFVKRAPPPADDEARRKCMKAKIEAAIREEAADKLDAVIHIALRRGEAKKAAARKSRDGESDQPSQSGLNMTSTRSVE